MRDSERALDDLRKATANGAPSSLLIELAAIEVAAGKRVIALRRRAG
jgi:hypothetical protein